MNRGVQKKEDERGEVDGHRVVPGDGTTSAQFKKKYIYIYKIQPDMGESWGKRREREKKKCIGCLGGLYGRTEKEINRKEIITQFV